MMATETPGPDPREIIRSLGILDTRIITPIVGGWDTLLWRVDAAERSYALRLFRAEQVSRPQREAAAMGVARAAGCPVPTIHAEGTWEDRPFLLLSWCPGRPLADVLGRQPWRAWSLGLACGRAQAQLHRAAAPATFRQDDWISWAGTSTEALRPKLESTGLRSDRLIHLDYHPRNVMIENGQVSAVLDWANAQAGDPRADLARTVSILRLAPLPGPALFFPLVTAILRLFEAGWRHGYEGIAGPVGSLAPFYAWAGAVILRDLAPKVGQVGIPLTEGDLDRMREWADEWRNRIA